MTPSEPEPVAETRYQEFRNLTGVRILAVMPSIPLQGMERANVRIMAMMRERGADVLFVTERTYGQRVQRAVEEARCRWVAASVVNAFEERLHLTSRPREMAGVLRAWARAARQIAGIHRDYQPTHVYVTNLSFFLYALPVVWGTRGEVVFRLPNPPDIRSRDWKQGLVRLLWKRVIDPACDVVVCNSEYTSARLGDVGVRREKVHVIYNPLPERPRVRISDAPHVNPEQFNVLYLGRIRPEKGVGELVEVARRIVHERRDVDFYLVGEHKWKNPFAQDLIEKVRADGMDHRIHVLDEIEDVFGLLAQCHLHVCPSVSPGESLPNVVLEAKSQGIPSVVFATGGLPEVVTHLVDGYVCSGKNAAVLYEGIVFFLENRGALEVAGRAARRSAERFSRDRIAEEWVRVFKAGAPLSRTNVA